MNRRNFVVGLGTVATISGVASVTAASFADQVSPTANFQVIPQNAELVVRQLSNYPDNEAYFASSELDFANATSGVSSDVVAYVNESENGQLGTQLALNNTNGTSAYDQYHAPNATGSSNFSSDSDGFFEVANLGETDETIAITLNYNNDVVVADGSDEEISESDVANLFQFMDNDGNVISPDPEGDSPDASTPETDVEITSGSTETIGLAINLTSDLYDKIQNEAGGSPFEETSSSLQLLESIEVGNDYTF